MVLHNIRMGMCVLFLEYRQTQTLQVVSTGSWKKCASSLCRGFLHFSAFHFSMNLEMMEENILRGKELLMQGLSLLFPSVCTR